MVDRCIWVDACTVGETEKVKAKGEKERANSLKRKRMQRHWDET